jgi:hypothetical protein
MSLRRTILLTACVAATAMFTAAPAGAQGPTENPVPGAQPGKCTDAFKPSSSFTKKAARRAGKTRLLRGTARDVGCGLNGVQISVQRKHGKKCRNLTSHKRLGRAVRCGKRAWLPVRGTSRWSFRLPKRLAHGRYLVRTRASDFAGNVQSVRVHRLTLRRAR